MKNSREYFPDRAKCLGILPSSSMMWAMWSMEERKKRIREWEGQREGWDKRRGKKIEISKKSKIDSNQQCLRTPCRGSWGWRASGTVWSINGDWPQLTPRPPQHCKQISMEMVRFTDGIQARIPRFSTQLPKRTEKWAADWWTQGPQRGSAVPTACPLLATGHQTGGKQEAR